MIGRFVDVTASLTAVTVFCDGQVVARHERGPGPTTAVVTDPGHKATAVTMRQALADDRQRRAGRDPPPHRRPRRRVAGAAGLRRPVRRRLRPHPDQPSRRPEASNP